LVNGGLLMQDCNSYKNYFTNSQKHMEYWIEIIEAILAFAVHKKVVVEASASPTIGEDKLNS